jgi:UPF0716 protein FxsA
VLLGVLLALGLLAALEIYVIITVAHLIGGLLTAVLLIVSTMGGLWLARIQRRRAWDALREAMANGVVPDRELADAAVILAAGVLIAIPGFVTDVLGLFAVIPFTRPVVRRLLTRWMSRRAALAGMQMMPPRRPGRNAPAEPGDEGGPVIQGEVLEDRGDRTGSTGRSGTETNGDDDADDGGTPRHDGTP